MFTILFISEYSIKSQKNYFSFSKKTETITKKNEFKIRIFLLSAAG